MAGDIDYNTTGTTNYIYYTVPSELDFTDRSNGNHGWESNIWYQTNGFILRALTLMYKMMTNGISGKELEELKEIIEENCNVEEEKEVERETDLDGKLFEV